MSSPESKRFIISKEPFSQERLRATQEAVRELQENNPEILGLGLFGSLTKGKSRGDSDIDGYLFVDADEIKKNTIDKTDIVEYKRTLGKGNVTEETMGIKRLSVYPHFNEVLDNYYEELLRDAVKAKLSELTDEQIEHLRVFPISEKIINTLLNDFAAHKVQQSAFLEELKSYNQEEIKTIDDVKDVVSKMTNKPPEVNPNVSLLFNAMFFLQIGNGIRKYRKILLDKLSTMGPLGEKVWEGIITAQKEFERGGGKNDENEEGKKRYPETLKEAIVVYG